MSCYFLRAYPEKRRKQAFLNIKDDEIAASNIIRFFLGI